MRVRHYLQLALLTAIYLCFEMAFNARLLDVVGSQAGPGAIHHIEVFGRCLSGVAVALVVLQVQVARRLRINPTLSWRDGPFMAAACTLAGVLTYFSLSWWVDALVEHSSPEFRKTSASVLLVQRALVEKTAVLHGLDVDPRLFSRPEGKAFLALFPLLAAHVEPLEPKIQDLRLALLTQQVSQSLTKNDAFQTYNQAVSELRRQWQAYRALGESLQRQQDQAWADYVRDLGQRGWAPSSVPALARRRVVSEVRLRLPVPANWLPHDQVKFRQAVIDKARQQMSPAAIEASRLPTGLDFPAFVAQTEVQSRLRESLRLPANIALTSHYRDGEDFEQRVLQPAIAQAAATQLRRYDSPAVAFQDGGLQANLGREAARAALVPPLALLFSLLGALGHMTKLVYLLLKAAALRQRKSVPGLGLVPLGLLLGGWMALSAMQNQVTRSDFYESMTQQVRQQASLQGAPSQWEALALIHGLHVVAVGQGLGYPINETIRLVVLRGITFGYTP